MRLSEKILWTAAAVAYLWAAAYFLTMLYGALIRVIAKSFCQGFKM
jgi:hypothetical protein